MRRPASADNDPSKCATLSGTTADSLPMYVWAKSTSKRAKASVLCASDAGVENTSRRRDLDKGSSKGERGMQAQRERERERDRQIQEDVALPERLEHQSIGSA